jgi:hypothetical protein
MFATQEDIFAGVLFVISTFVDMEVTVDTLPD